MREFSAPPACMDVDPEIFFPHGEERRGSKGDLDIEYAVSICAGCVVRQECLTKALEKNIKHGIWGGMTSFERGALLRKHNKISA